MTEALVTETANRAPQLSRRPFRLSRNASRALRPWYRITPLIIGLVLVAFLVLVAVLAPMIATHDPIQQNLTAILQSPSAQHWLGTDKVGRDVFSRLVYGTRVDLRVGFLAVLIPFVVGSALGAVSGYFGGVIDAVIMRIVDVFFAFPFYVLVIALVYVLGSGERAIYLAIAAVSWVSYCRIVRAEVLVAKNQDYVVAARLGGLSHGRIIGGHILRNVIAQAVVYAMSDIVLDILAIVTLGYLGLGIQPPAVDLGKMIFDGQSYLTTYWRLSTIPGIAVVIIALGLALIADGLADLLRPE